MSKFKENKIEKFFTDDHIAARFKKLNDKMKSEISLFIKEKNYRILFLMKKILVK